MRDSEHTIAPDSNSTAGKRPIPHSALNDMIHGQPDGAFSAEGFRFASALPVKGTPSAGDF